MTSYVELVHAPLPDVAGFHLRNGAVLGAESPGLAGLTANIDSERVGVCNECDSARRLGNIPNGYAGCERGGLSLDRFSYGRLFEFPAQLSHEFV